MKAEDIYGLDYSDPDHDKDRAKHENHVYSSECKECEVPISPEFREYLIKMGENSSFDYRPRMTWITGHVKKDE